MTVSGDTVEEMIWAAAGLDPEFANTEYTRGMVELIYTVLGADAMPDLVIVAIKLAARCTELTAENRNLSKQLSEEEYRKQLADCTS